MKIRCDTCEEVVTNGEIFRMFIKNGDCIIHVRCSKCGYYVDAEYIIDINGMEVWNDSSN